MSGMKWALIVVAVVVALVVVAVLAVPYLVDMPRVQAAIAGQVSTALGRPVKFSGLSVRVLPLPSVVLRDLEIGEDPAFGTDPFLRLDSGALRLKVGPLLRGRLEFGELVLRKPVIAVVQNPDGRLNVATLGAAAEAKTPPPPARDAPGAPTSSPMALPVSSVRIEDGVVSYLVRGASGAGPRYRVEELDLRLTGTPSQLAFRADGQLMPGRLALRLRDGQIALNGKPLTEAPLRGTLALDGRDITELVAAAAGPSPAIGGSLQGTLALGGTVGAPTAAGDVELTKLSVTQTQPGCPDPKTRTLTLPAVKTTVTYKDGQLTGRPLTTSLGGGTATTNGAGPNSFVSAPSRPRWGHHDDHHGPHGGGGGRVLFVSDGNATVHVVDMDRMTIIKSISVAHSECDGGTETTKFCGRSNEIEYDPVHQLIAVSNPNPLSYVKCTAAGANRIQGNAPQARTAR